MSQNKLVLNQETLTNLLPKSDDNKIVGCTLHSDLTFRISCPGNCVKAE